MSKFTKKHFYCHLITDIISSLFLGLWAVMLVFGGEEEELIFEPHMLITGAIIAAVAYVLLAVYHYLFIKTSHYEVTDTSVACTQGVLFKKTSVIEYQKIHAMTKRQSLIQRIFGYGRLMIDSGSTVIAHTEEIIIIESNAEMEALIKIISKKQKEANGETDGVADITADNISEKSESDPGLYKFTSKLKFVYSSLNALGIIFAIYVLIAAAALFMRLIYPLVSAAVSVFGEYIWYIVIVPIAVSLVVLIISIISAFVQYFGFKIQKNDRSIIITHGLFTKQTHTFHRDRIKAVRIKQGFIKKIFGYASIDVEVIGYNNVSSNENSTPSNVLIPICKKNEAHELIEKIVGKEYIPSQTTYGCRSVFSLMSWTLLFFNISSAVIFSQILLWTLFAGAYRILLILGILCLCITLLVDILIIINSLLKHRTEGIGITEQSITAVHGGFSTHTNTVLKSHIIGIENVTTPMQKKRGIHTYLIHIRTNALTNVIRVQSLDSELCRELEDCMTV